MNLLDDSDLRVAVILPAAGRGERFAAGNAAAPSKIEFLLDGRPVFMHALAAFCGRAEVVQVLLAVAPDRVDEFSDRYGDRLRDLGVMLVAGAAEGRTQTVRRALRRVDDKVTHVAVHDAARPLVGFDLVTRVFAAAADHGAVVPALAVADTLVRGGLPLAGDAGRDPLDDVLGLTPAPGAGVRPVVGAVDRDGLFAVQTPQVFEVGLLRRAYAQPAADGGATDDASLVAALGEPVVLVEGEAANLKLTRPQDAELLAALCDRRRAAEAERRRARDPLFADEDEDGQAHSFEG